MGSCVVTTAIWLLSRARASLLLHLHCPLGLLFNCFDLTGVVVMERVCLVAYVVHAYCPRPLPPTAQPVCTPATPMAQRLDGSRRGAQPCRHRWP